MPQAGTGGKPEADPWLAGSDAPPDEPPSVEEQEAAAAAAAPDPAEGADEAPKAANEAPETPTAADEPGPAPAEAEKPDDPAPPTEQPSAPAASADIPASRVPDALMGGMLDDQSTYVSELLYGPEGTGKTTAALRMTLLCGDNQVVYLIDAEAGAKVRALKQRGVDTSKIRVWPTAEDGGPSAITFDGLHGLAEEIEELGPDRVVGCIWDSGTEITRRILDDVTATAREKDERLGKVRGRFQVNLEDHGVASSMLRELLRKYRSLPCHLVITALERRDVDNDTGRVKYGPNMSPAMANDTAGLVDIVGYCTVDLVGGEEIRSARFVPLELRRAKDRFGVLPNKLADPYFDRVFAYVDGEMTKENDPVQAHVRELATAAAAASNQG